MEKLLNTRIEKKQQARLVLIDIREYKRRKIRKYFEEYFKSTDDMIIISRAGDIRTVYTSWEDADTVYELNKVLKCMLNY